MTNFGALRDRFRNQLGKDLRLLTITFDPKYDTPDKMKAYAERYGADLPGWRMLTGSAGDIGRVCSLFGVEFWPEEGMITHTLQTAVIDRQGRLVADDRGKGVLDTSTGGPGAVVGRRSLIFGRSRQSTADFA